MRTSPRRFLLLSTLAIVSLAAEVAPQMCPTDKTPMTPTGETRQEAGKVLAEYRCEKGHLFWVAVD